MDREGASRLSCVVCGIETKRHAGWFLVRENYWLDRVKILSWHPVLARERGMRGVCSKLHLKMLLTHRLNHANLQLIGGSIGPLPISTDTSPAGSSYARSSLGRVVGELAVERLGQSSGVDRVARNHGVHLGRSDWRNGDPCTRSGIDSTGALGGIFRGLCVPVT